MFDTFFSKAHRDASSDHRMALSRDRVWPPWALGLLLALAVLLAYCNSPHSPFTYDDYNDVLENTSIRHLWPLRDVFWVRGKGFLTRPIVNLTFALDYALGGLRPFLFHLTNLAIHLGASLALLGVLRRSLSLPVFRGRFQAHLSALALVPAALWALHPLQTESVSYITQRYESLMAFFVLGAFYALLRSQASPHPRRWQAAGILSCLLALGSKEVAVSLPILVLFFDRTFLAGAFREIWRARKRFYAGLALTWVPFLYIQLHALPRNFAASSATMPWWRYALNQPRVIAHYLRLAVWPHPLVFDYFWKAETAWRPLLPGMIAMAGLLGFTLWALVRRPKLAFLPIFFLAILAPTSSVMPILDLAVEHRMYLPLAPVIVALVLGIHSLLMRLQAAHPHASPLARPVILAGLAGILASLGILTFLRNEDYRDALDLWRSVTLAVPNNPRGHNNYAFQLAERGNLAEAAREYDKTVALAPQAPLFQSNYGLTLARLGQYQAGLEHLRTAVKLEPTNPQYIDNLGFVLLMKGSVDNAATCFETAIQLDPSNDVAYGGLASVAQAKRNLIKARGYIKKAIGINPYNPSFREHQAQILMDLGDVAGAREAFHAGVRLLSSAEKISDLGWTMHGRALDADALDALRQALAMVPDHAKTRIRMAWLLATSQDASLRNGPEAVRQAETVLQSQHPVRSPETLDLLAVALAEAGRFPEARAALQEALAQSKDRQESWVPGLEKHLALFERQEPFHDATINQLRPGPSRAGVQ